MHTIGLLYISLPYKCTASNCTSPIEPYKSTVATHQHDIQALNRQYTQLKTCLALKLRKIVRKYRVPFSAIHDPKITFH